MYIVYPDINIPAKNSSARTIYSGIRQFLRRNCIAIPFGYIVAAKDYSIVMKRLEMFREDWERATGTPDGFAVLLVDAQCDTVETFTCIQQQVLKHCAEYVEHILDQYKARKAAHDNNQWMRDRRSHAPAKLPYEFVLRFSDLFPSLMEALRPLKNAAVKLCAPDTLDEGIQLLAEAVEILHGKNKK